MSTLTRKPSARKPVLRQRAATKPALEQEMLSLADTRTPPPAKSTAADLLRSLRNGSFERAAAKVDWTIVEAVVKGRRSSAVLRAAQA